MRSARETGDGPVPGAVAEAPSVPGPLLSVRDLSVSYRQGQRRIAVLRGVSLEVGRGQALALIGESGCGKTTLGLALTRLLPKSAEVGGGSITFHGKMGRVSVLDLPAEAL